MGLFAVEQITVSEMERLLYVTYLIDQFAREYTFPYHVSVDGGLCVCVCVKVHRTACYKM